jgi:galactokinase
MRIPVRRLPEVRASGDLKWFHPARGAARASPVFVARAPARLDVMGGIADYSGARVLELPLERATTVVLEAQTEPRCDVVTLREGRRDAFSLDLGPLVDERGTLGTPAALAAWFAAHPAERWAGYVVGMVQLVLQRARRDGRAAPRGISLLIRSSVPAGRGVASSAALEVAAGAALAAACDDPIDAAHLAAACQAVENHVVGAPCGIMDQMTSACGRRDRLLQLRCQPGTIEGHLPVPDGFRFYGIDSGLSHAVSGADYGTVRTAAFMGYRIIADRAGSGSGDARWHGYLANLTLDEFSELGRGLPEEMSGAEFLKRYDGITDPVTVVRGERRYPVRQATAHPVREQARVDRFIELLAVLGEQSGAAQELGALMDESHGSYGACGLGSPGTDRLVALVRAEGPKRGLYGAKITGGGSGGTVAVLATSDAEPVVRDIAARYRAETGAGGDVFTGSGPGAAETGVLWLAPEDRLEAVADGERRV